MIRLAYGSESVGSKVTDVNVYQTFLLMTTLVPLPSSGSSVLSPDVLMNSLNV